MLRILLILFFCGVYVFSAYPTIAGGDSPELSTAAIVLGIPHAPGFPLYVIAGKLFSVIMPFGNYGYRLNIFSSLLLAISLGLFFNLLKELGASSLAGLGATILLALNPLFQAQAQSSEVFALTIFLALIMFNLALARNIGTISRPGLISFLLGLTLGSHQIIIIFLPLLATILIQSDKPRNPIRTLTSATFLFLLGLTIYLIFLVISRRQPIVNFGSPKNLSGLIDLFVRRHFGPTQLHPTTLGFRSLSLFANQLFSYFSALWSRFGLAGILLIFTGLFFPQNFPLTLVLFSSFLVAGPVFSVYTNLAPNTLNLWRLERFWLLADFFLIIIAANGYQTILKKFSPPAQMVLSVLLIFHFASLHPLFSQRNNFLFWDFAKNLIRSAPPNRPIIFTTKMFDEPASTVAYLETVRKTRRELISRSQTILKNIYPPDFLSLSEKQKISRAIERETTAFPREIYYSAFEPADLPAPVSLNGLLYVWRPEATRDVPEEIYPWRLPALYSWPDYLIPVHYYYLFAKRCLENNQPVKAQKYFHLATTFGRGMSWLYYNIATIYLRQQNFPVAEEYLKLSINCDPYFAENYFALGYLFYRRKNYPSAEKNFLLALKMKPHFPEVYYNLAVLAAEQKDFARFNYYQQQYERETGEKIWKPE